MNPLNTAELFNDELWQNLLISGNKLADDFNIKFISATSQFYKQSNY